MNEDPIVEGTTCFKEHEDNAVPCSEQFAGKRTCRYWMPCTRYCNCSLIAAKHGEHTLQEIGDIFGITRMRVCQIEKSLREYLPHERNMRKYSE